MKKSNLKHFFSGVVTTILIIALTTGIFAAGQGTLIEVFYGTINDMVINNVSKMPEGELKPFIYKGSTFVPLRFVLENLGEEVDWDGSTRTIYIGDIDKETAVYIGNGITNMNYQEGYSSNSYREDYGGIYSDNINNEYNSGLRVSIYRSKYRKDLGWSYLEYPLNGEYDSFKATFGLTEKYKSADGETTLEIYGDGNLLSTQKLKAGDMPKEIEVNTENILKIRFKLISNGEGWAQVGLFDARFVK